MSTELSDSNLMEKITETAQWLWGQTEYRPSVAIVLGSGLGDYASQIQEAQTIDYKDIPNFPISTVEGHKGKLIFGRIAGHEVMAMQGRFHYYEGYSMKQVTFPVRVMKEFGIKTLLLSNAAGGLNPSFHQGDIMIIRDHINFFPEHPLRGKNDSRLGVRFPDMGNAYSPRLREIAKDIACKHQLPVWEGVYIGSSGPTFETPAEYKLFHHFGADASGMSTVPEVIVARHGDMEVFAASVITNCASFDIAKEVSHEEVQQTGAFAQQYMTVLFNELISEL